MKIIAGALSLIHLGIVLSLLCKMVDGVAVGLDGWRWYSGIFTISVYQHAEEYIDQNLAVGYS